jgi:hypothetical protein
MKFYSYTNENENYTKAISLNDVRAIERNIGSGKSAIRFSVSLTYCDGSDQSLPWLHEEESKKIYKEIVELLNTRA